VKRATGKGKGAGDRYKLPARRRRRRHCEPAAQAKDLTAHLLARRAQKDPHTRMLEQPTNCGRAAVQMWYLRVSLPPFRLQGALAAWRRLMKPHPAALLPHVSVNRREMIQAGALGLLGATLPDLFRSQACAGKAAGREKSVIYLFQSGGPPQHETFDLKPDAPDTIRGDFKPIATATPGMNICEHLPRLAKRSNRFAILRSLTHKSNDHSAGTHIMLTGRNDLPAGFNPNKPSGTDWPSLPATVQYALTPGDAPTAAILPHLLIHRTGRTLPGQQAGLLGSRHDAWVIEAAAKCTGYGACPLCFFHDGKTKFSHGDGPLFQPPHLQLPAYLSVSRVQSRHSFLEQIEQQRRALDQAGETADKFQRQALDLLTSGRVRRAFNLEEEGPRVLDAYGRHQFGRSFLLARRLVEAGVRMVHVNVGNQETWDTHERAFINLKDSLLPPFDQALAALLDDLENRGVLEDTLVVTAGEFGRTPKIFAFSGAISGMPGRDHWGAVQSCLFAGGGVRGGALVGSSDKQGAYPKTQPHTPADLAATVFSTLGIDPRLEFKDAQGRPLVLCDGDRITELFGGARTARVIED
jgi:hypothetical protein